MPVKVTVEGPWFASIVIFDTLRGPLAGGGDVLKLENMASMQKFVILGNGFWIQ